MGATTEVQHEITPLCIISEAHDHLVAAGIPRTWIDTPGGGALDYETRTDRLEALYLELTRVEVEDIDGVASEALRWDTLRAEYRDKLKDLWGKRAFQACTIQAMRLSRAIINGVDGEHEVTSDPIYQEAVIELARTLAATDRADFTYERLDVIRYLADLFEEHDENPLSRSLADLADKSESSLIQFNDESVKDGRPEDVINMFSDTIKRLSTAS